MATNKSKPQPEDEIAPPEDGTAPPEDRTAPTRSAPKDDTTYTRDDLMAAASAFGTTPEVMAGALRAADIGDDGATKADAERAVAAFSEREV